MGHYREFNDSLFLTYFDILVHNLVHPPPLLQLHIELSYIKRNQVVNLKYIIFPQHHILITLSNTLISSLSYWTHYSSTKTAGIFAVLTKKIQ